MWPVLQKNWSLRLRGVSLCGQLPCVAMHHCQGDQVISNWLHRERWKQMYCAFLNLSNKPFTFANGNQDHFDITNHNHGVLWVPANHWAQGWAYGHLTTIKKNSMWARTQSSSYLLIISELSSLFRFFMLNLSGVSSSEAGIGFVNFVSVLSLHSTSGQSAAHRHWWRH
jgi:hypothetical protein